MSAASMKANLRGVSKRKGKRSRLVTRNRSKVEKLRESLDYLKLEEKQIEPSRNNVYMSDDGATLRVLLCDLAVPVDARGVRVPVQNDRGLPLGGVIKKHSWETQKGCNSQVNPQRLRQTLSEELIGDSSETFQGLSVRCTDKEYRARSKESGEADVKSDERRSRASFTSVSEKTVSEKSPKRKSESDVQETKLKNFKGSSSRFNWEKLGQFSAISSEEMPSVTTEETHIAIDNDQHSPTHPNSPLYDMPPPSTPAQKQARRAKRQLQVERWKKYELSRSRQERYQRRTQGALETTLSLDSRHVQWSHDLVQTVYIDDKFD